MIRNTSDEAIINCRVHTLEGRSKWVVAKREPDVSLVPPNEPARGSTGVVNTVLPNEDHPRPPVQLIFTDAAGVQWWRDSHGNLELSKRPER